MIHRITRAALRSLAAISLLLVLAAPGLAQSNCVTGVTVPLDLNFSRNSPGVLRLIVNGHVSALRLDRDRNGSVDADFDLPGEAWDATNYFLSPAEEFVIAISCPNVPSCLPTGGPNAGNPTTIAIMRVPATAGPLELVHTDCLGGGLLNGNGRWYEAGLCNAPSQGQACGAPASYALGVTGCNKIFVARTDNGGNNTLVIYNLNDSTPDPTDGRAAIELNDGVEDTTLAIDRGGNFILAKSGTGLGATTYDYNLIDACPGSANFGMRILGGVPPYVNIPASAGVPSAMVTCSSGALSVQPRTGSTPLGPAITVSRCCTNTPPPMGRCCNYTTGVCSVTTLADCPAATSTWTIGGDCNTPCPVPPPDLDLVATGPSAAVAGELITLSFVCSNTGFGPANDVAVTLNLSTSFVSIESAGAGGTIAGGQVSWSVGTLAPGAQSQQLTVTVRPTCGAVSQTFNVVAQAASSNGHGTTSHPVVTVATSIGDTSAIGASLVSTPSLPPPLLPGGVVTHTITLVNPDPVTRWRTTFSTPAGAAARFDQGIDAAGGTFLPGANVRWVGDLAPSSTNTISFTTRIVDCPPPNVASTQLGGGSPIFITTGCQNTLAVITGAPAFAVTLPLTFTLAVDPVAGHATGAPGLLGSPSTVLVRPGESVGFTLNFHNVTASPVNGGFAQILFPSDLQVANPPFGTPLPGLSWDNATRTMTYSGTLNGGESVSIGFDTTLADTARCSATLTVTGGYGPCRFTAASIPVFKAVAPPAGDYLVGQDYIDGLWTFRPGIDTELQTLLCFNFGGSGSGGLSRSPGGDIFMAQPFIRYNPATLEYQALSAPADGVGDVAYNAADNSLVLVSGGGLSRYDLTSGVTQRIVADPADYFIRAAVGADGRIMVVGSSGLRLVDPRPPAVLPLSVADIVNVPLPMVTFRSGATGTPSVFAFRTLTIDGAGDYIVTASYDAPGGTAVPMIKIAAATLATTVIIPAISGPVAVAPLTTDQLPRTCSAVGPSGEFYLGTVLPAGLVSVDETAVPPVRSLISAFSPGCLDMAHTNPGIVAGPCPADFNGDGVLNADDIADFITAYFNTPPDATTDFNADGVINSDDLSDFITAYFNGC